MRYFAGLLSGMSLVVLIAAVDQPPRHAGERWLADFNNDDGSHPDGQTRDQDDSSALQRALNAGPGVVRIGPGTFYMHDVGIPEDVELIGSGSATVLRTAAGRPVISQKDVTGWKLRDLVLQGEASGDWTKRTDLKSHGLVIEGCHGYEVTGVTVRDFRGAGVQIGRTNLPASGWADGGRLSQVTAHGCAIGVRFDTRGEYVTASQVHCYNNVTGVIIHAGNVNLANCNLGANLDGVLIEDHENGSHGSLSGCLINHNQRDAIRCENAENGMVITGCCVFYGTIRLENCSGITLSSNLLSCGITTSGDKFNRIAGNHIIPGEHLGSTPFTFAAATQVTGNYTKEGDWEFNR